MLTVLRHGDVCIGGDAAVNGWLPVWYAGRPGHAAAAWLRELPPPDGVTLPAPLPPAANVDDKDRDLAHLHPHARSAVEAVLAALESEGLPFRVFEAVRSCYALQEEGRLVSVYTRKANVRMTANGCRTDD